MRSFLMMLIILWAFSLDAGVAMVRVVALDEETRQPIADVGVKGWFKVRGNIWDSVKGPPKQNVDEDVTDRHGRCLLSGGTDVGEVTVQVTSVPYGYHRVQYDKVKRFKLNMLGVWLTDDIVVTFMIKRFVNPIPLFVKRLVYNVGEQAKVDSFSKNGGTLEYDLEEGDWLPPIGNGKIADIEFCRLPPEPLGKVTAHGKTRDSTKFAMRMRFLGANNGIVLIDTNDGLTLKVREAPETGYTPEIVSWVIDHGPDLQFKTSRDKDRAYCFRIRTKVDDSGEIISAKYGKIYGDVWALYTKTTTIQYVSYPQMLYYLNPNSMDRNLEWNRVNTAGYGSNIDKEEWFSLLP